MVKYGKIKGIKKEKMMKRPACKILLAVIIAVISVCMSVSVFAKTDSNDIRGQNLTYGGEKISLLDERCIEHYMQKSGVGDDRADTKTCAVIQGYVSEIRALIFSERVDTEDLREEIEVLYQKGIASGILSWIYYSNADVGDCELVTDAYNAQLAVIASKGASDVGFFLGGDGRAEVEVCYTLLLQSVYAEKINRLSQEGDSETVRGIILAAPSALGSNYSYDNSSGDGEDGKNYESFFEKIKASVGIQRDRDRVSAELRGVFSKLYPDYDFDRTALLSDFRNSLNTKTTAADMNTLVSDTLIMLLEGLKREDAIFRNRFLNTKKGEVFDEKERANGEATVSILNLSPIFSDFEHELCLSDVEDFRTAHGEILEKKEITASDREEILSAISHADRLSLLCQTVLEAELDHIGRAYKAAVTDEIKALIKKDRAEGLRIYACERITELISSISPKDGNGRFALSALKDRADVYLKKAVALDEVFSVYDGEYLNGVTRFFGTEASSAVKIAADSLIDGMEGSEDKIKSEIIPKIWRYAALERIYTEAYGFEDIDGISAILSEFRADIEGTNERSVIAEYELNATAGIKEKIRQSAVREGLKEIDALSAKVGNAISKYKYISESRREELLVRISEIKSAAYIEIGNAPDLSRIEQIGRSAMSELNSVSQTADKEEKAACLEAVKKEIMSNIGTEGEYSKENYKTLVALIATFEESLSSAHSIPEYEAIRDETLENVKKIENLLSTARREGKEKLFAEYSRLLKKNGCFSAEGLAKLEEIYNRSVFELTQLQSPATVGDIKKFTEERIALLRGVNMDKAYTEGSTVSSEGEFVTPEGYSPFENGYVGSVYAPGGIASDAELIISHTDSDGISELLKKAAKKKRIFYSDGSLVGKALLKKLKNCNILAAVDIGLYTDGIAANREYKVSLLLPEGTDTSKILGIVFVRDDGSVEFYDVASADRNIDFTTDHFSKYYIISEGKINLAPLIICLCIIVLCEILVLLAVVARRKKKKGEDTSDVVSLSGFAPVLLGVKYTPKGGLFAVIVLGTAAVALSCAIIYLLMPDIIELKRKTLARKMKKAEPEISELPEADIPCLASCAVGNGAIVASDHERELSEAEKLYGDGGEYGKEPLLSEEISVAFPLSSVSAEEAEMLMSDEEASKGRNDEYIDSEEYIGTRKAEINIDTISRMFYAGDTVTLNSLKEKRLVGQKVGSVKVLGRGVLDKPLRVVAQDFSASAVKMILLTGGDAIISGKKGSKQ